MQVIRNSFVPQFIERLELVFEQIEADHLYLERLAKERGLLLYDLTAFNPWIFY